MNGFYPPCYIIVFDVRSMCFGGVFFNFFLCGRHHQYLLRVAVLPIFCPFPPLCIRCCHAEHQVIHQFSHTLKCSCSRIRSAMQCNSGCLLFYTSNMINQKKKMNAKKTHTIDTKIYMVDKTLGSKCNESDIIQIGLYFSCKLRSRSLYTSLN